LLVAVRVDNLAEKSIRRLPGDRRVIRVGEYAIRAFARVSVDCRG